MCDCEACDGNYPASPNLGFKEMKILKFAKKADEEILTLKPSPSLKKYRDCCEIIDKRHENFPCIELSLLQKCLAMFLLKQAEPSCLFP